MILIYNALLFLLLLVSLPKLLYHRIKKKKYKGHFNQKLGSPFKLIKRGKKPLVWIHAVSVGETKAIAPLAKRLKDLPHSPELLITSVTDTGHSEAMRSMPFADYHFLMPFDFSWIIRPIIRRLKPDLVLLCETDFWFNFLDEAKKQGAKIALINGKLSERSFSRFKRFHFLSKRLFQLFDLYCVQSQRYAKRFELMGVPPNHIVITGNVKLDNPAQPLLQSELEILKKRFGIGPDESVIVAGCTHAPEEELILDAFKQCLKDHPHLKLIIAPRHPERFTEVLELIKKSHLKHINYTDLDHADGHEKIILMNAMGVLKTSYQLADIAIVGGSFTAKVGGHNILEPSVYGKPVIFGPHMHTQLDFVELIRDANAGIQVTKDQLTNTLINLLNTPQKASEIGLAGLKLTESTQGATRHTFESLTKYFAKAPLFIAGKEALR